MQIRKFGDYIKQTGVLVMAFILLVLIFKKFVVDSPVFNFVASDQKTNTWEQYLDNRSKRNEAKMKQSYAELMRWGRFYAEEENWSRAHENFYYAKTLFPDKIGPRKNLCYSYLMMCQEDWRFCDKGKKELYYALKYVQPSDKISYEYLYQLVELVEMEDIVEMEEGEALAAIY